MIRRGIGVQSFVSAGGGTDADAQAVITAIESTGVTLTATQKTACNTLVTDLKSYGIWTKLKAVYGFLGGTAGAHKWNWKNPADTDAAFRLVFNGGGTHSSTGYLPNGTNGYGDSKLNPTNNLTLNSVSFGIYSRTNNTSSPLKCYGVNAADTNIFQQNLQSGNYIIGNYNVGFITYNANPSTGMMIATRRNANDFQGYRNGISVGIDTSSSSTNVNGNFYFGARNRADLGSVDAFSPHELAFAFIGDALTNQNCIDLTTAVNNYQISLSRNV